MPISLEEWKPWYERIIEIFAYDKKRDILASKLLSSLLIAKSITRREIRSIIKKRDILVLGAGPSIEQDLKNIVTHELHIRCVTIAADGAATAALEIGGFLPHIVVSDLDGQMEDILQSHELGTKLVIHAHGDNITKLKQYLPKISRAFGTTQTRPYPRVHNLGGFTDGDRCVFLGDHFGANLIALAGMDLGTEVGKYSKAVPKSYDVKVKKLSFCKMLLEWLAAKTEKRLYNITANGEDIKGFRRLSAESMGAILKRS